MVTEPVVTLCSARELLGREVEAEDARLGRVTDLCFDDRDWLIRHVVVQTGRWPRRRRVALPSVKVALTEGQAALRVDEPREAALQRRQLPACIDEARRRRIELSRVRLWLPHWSQPGAAAPAAEASVLRRTEERLVLEDQNADRDLRSLRRVLGYEVHAAGRRVGRVDDLIADAERWRVSRLVARTGWLGRGERLLVRPNEVEVFSAAQGRIDLERRRERSNKAADRA